LQNTHSADVAANIGLKSCLSVYCSFTITERVWSGFPFGQYQTVQSTVQSAGSGVIYQLEDGGSAYVITNHHVVYDYRSITQNKISDDINLYLYGMEGSEYAIPAKYVGGSLNYDIAVLRVENNSILDAAIKRGVACAAEFANSDNIRVGQTSIAIGNPEAYGISVTCGIVSVDSEYISMTAVDNQTTIQLRVIRTDTAVNSGNSGGGLFDDTGKLIGIVNAKSGDTSVENIAYAIPCNVVKAIAENIIYYNKMQNSECVMRVLLNVTIDIGELTTAVDEETGFLIKKEQVKIDTVSSDSIVKNILQSGDIINSVTIDGKETQITRRYQFIDVLLDARVGTKITLKYTRNGEQLSSTVTVTTDCLAEY
ncbi:MAG: S1C family serine protease, partial [Corallococcus sp.]|nr:S1C family serine protease [Corallococcus sp.]